MTETTLWDTYADILAEAGADAARDAVRHADRLASEAAEARRNADELEADAVASHGDGWRDVPDCWDAWEAADGDAIEVLQWACNARDEAMAEIARLQAE